MERKRTLKGTAQLAVSDFFARFKTDGFSWRDRDLAPRSGVSPHSAFAGLDAEDAEPSEFDPLPVVHGRFQNLKNGIHSQLRLYFWDSHLHRDAGHDVPLDHQVAPLYSIDILLRVSLTSP